MKLLLDTHALIWFAENDVQLSSKAKFAIENLENESFISIASFWEIAIKQGLNKINLSRTLSEVAFFIKQNGIQILPITIDHLLILSELPLYHRDPFDRLLVAQSQCEQMTFISKDIWISPYQISTLW
jgi:PIN domain nuclease of toxin-antitoxin system